MARNYLTSTRVALEKELLLHEAVIMNDAEIVDKILRTRGSFNINCRNNYGRVPIHLAASRGSRDIIDMLIKAKADIEIKDKFGMRPLHIAAWYGQQEAAEILIENGATVSAVDKKHRTLLMMASRSNGSASFLEYIIANIEPAIETRARDYDGASALHYATNSTNVQTINILVKFLPDLNINSRDQYGQTALHYACAAGQEEISVRLLELGASLIIQDLDGRTALHMAASKRESKLCSRLLGMCRSQDEINKILQISDRQGLTLLHMAASYGCSILLNWLFESQLKLSEALAKPCQYGNTPLHLAAKNNQLQAVDLLLEHGASLHALNHDMQTPLHLAREMGHSEMCRRLISAGAVLKYPVYQLNDQDLRNNNNTTTLRNAVKSSLVNIANIIARTVKLDYHI